MKPYIILMFILLIPAVQANTVMDRLFSTEAQENGICDDGEYFWHEDCRLTEESLWCEEACMLKQMWFVRLLLIAIAYIAYKKRKTLNLNRIAIIGLIVLLLLNIDMTPIKQGNNETVKNVSTNQTFNWGMVGNWDNIGSKIYPEKPNIGWIVFWIIAVVLILIVARYFGKITDRL